MIWVQLAEEVTCKWGHTWRKCLNPNYQEMLLVCRETVYVYLYKVLFVLYAMQVLLSKPDKESYVKMLTWSHVEHCILFLQIYVQ